MASLVISLRSLNLIGIALALALYRCRENHLYHLAPYATTRVKAILTKFLYAAFGSSCFPSILARVTSAAGAGSGARGAGGSGRRRGALTSTD